MKDYKEVDERFDKMFPKLQVKGYTGNTPAELKEVNVIGVDILIKDFIHSEIERAEKEVVINLEKINNALMR